MRVIILTQNGDIGSAFDQTRGQSMHGLDHARNELITSRWKFSKVQVEPHTSQGLFKPIGRTELPR